MIDVIICSKDHPKLLESQVQQIRRLIPFHEIIVVDSSEKLDKRLCEQLTVKVLHTPLVKLGFARQEGLLASQADLVFFIDDDIILEKDCFSKMYWGLNGDKVVATSGRVVYGWDSDPVMLKLFRHGRPVKQGGSGGLMLGKREVLLKLGGYNRDIHWGEDAELCQRIERHGYKWIRVLSAVSYHPSTLKEMISRNIRNGVGLKQLWLRGGTLRSLFFRLFGRTFFMPFYYGWQTLDPRVMGYYFLISFPLLMSFFWSLKK